jgi:hypothetical protein
MRLEGQLLAKEDCARRATDAISQLDSLLSLPYALNPLWTNGRRLGNYPSAFLRLSVIWRTRTFNF